MADESVEKLLEELLVKQANVRTLLAELRVLAAISFSTLTLFSISSFQWRNEQTILDRQNQQGSPAANTQTKLRRCVSGTSSQLRLITFFWVRTFQLCRFHLLPQELRLPHEQ